MTKDMKVEKMKEAEALLKVLSLSEYNMKQGKYKLLKQAFSDVRKRIDRFKKDNEM